MLLLASPLGGMISWRKSTFFARETVLGTADGARDLVHANEVQLVCKTALVATLDHPVECPTCKW